MECVGKQDTLAKAWVWPEKHLVIAAASVLFGLSTHAAKCPQSVRRDKAEGEGCGVPSPCLYSST